MAYITGFDRKQAQLFPLCIEERIPKVAEVRIIDQCNEQVDMPKFGFYAPNPDGIVGPVHDPNVF